MLEFTKRISMTALNSYLRFEVKKMMNIIKQSLYEVFAPKKRNHRITIFCIEMKNLLNQSPINRKMFTI